MFTTASPKNRVITSALSITYTVERRYETISGVKTYWYKVTRNAAKTYSYLDLTPAAAAEVMVAKVAKYTRTTRKCISRTLDKTFESLTTDISTSRNGSGSYNVDINVSETDSTHSATIPSNPATLFTTENARDYDEGESGVTVDSTTYDGTAMTLTINISVTGELVGTPISSVGLYYGGSRVTTGVTVTQTGDAAYRIVGTNWDSSHNTGTVAIGDAEAEWEFYYVPQSVTLTSASTVEDWGPDPGTYVALDLTATLVGFTEWAPEDVHFWVRDNTEGGDWEDYTSRLTVTAGGEGVNAVNGWHTLYVARWYGDFDFKATIDSYTSDIVNLTWDHR